MNINQIVLSGVIILTGCGGGSSTSQLPDGSECEIEGNTGGHSNHCNTTTTGLNGETGTWIHNPGYDKTVVLVVDDGGYTIDYTVCGISTLTKIQDGQGWWIFIDNFDVGPCPDGFTILNETPTGGELAYTWYFENYEGEVDDLLAVGDDMVIPNVIIDYEYGATGLFVKQN